MSHVASRYIFPKNLTIHPLPDDGSVDTTYMVSLDKNAFVYLLFGVKKFTISNAQFSGITDAFYYGGPDSGDSDDFDTIVIPSNEKTFLLGAQVWQGRSIPIPAPNPDDNYVWLGYSFSLGWWISSAYWDSENDCYWIAPPDFEIWGWNALFDPYYGWGIDGLGRVNNYFGGAAFWAIHPAGSQNEVDEQGSAGFLTFQLFDLPPFYIPLIFFNVDDSTPSGDNSVTASATITDSDYWQYTNDEIDS